MNQIVLHTSHSINCGRVVTQFIKGEKYLKYYNNYLIPYRCSYVNHDKQVILGNFVYPMWRSLERTILDKNEQFNYSYVKGTDFILEFHPSSYQIYKIMNQGNLKFYSIEISELLLKSNSILLFSIHKDVAEPFINNKLI